MKSENDHSLATNCNLPFNYLTKTWIPDFTGGERAEMASSSRPSSRRSDDSVNRASTLSSSF